MSQTANPKVAITFDVELTTEAEWKEAKSKGESCYKVTNSLAIFHITGHDSYFYNGCVFFARWGKTDWEYLKLS